MLLQNLYPKGQNSVIPRPLAAGIGILKVLPVYWPPFFEQITRLGMSHPAVDLPFLYDWRRYWYNVSVRFGIKLFDLKVFA
jgi:hypothetical protein